MISFAGCRSRDSEETAIKRILTALIALPLLVLLIQKGSPFLFAVFIAVTSFLALTEYFRMALPEKRLEGLVAPLCGAILTLVPMWQGGMATNIVLAAFTFVTLLFALLFLFRIDDITRAGRNFAIAVAGFLYVPLLLSHLVLLRLEPFGAQWIFLLLVIVMSGDTAAFYVGSSLGKRKLYPMVSPNKSVEGAVGGIMGSVVGSLLAGATFFPQLSVIDSIATAVLLGILGQLGDLFESLLKRTFGVKDSGAMIPGHGGILDRLDSILFAVPAAFYYARLMF